MKISSVGIVIALEVELFMRETNDIKTIKIKVHTIDLIDHRCTHWPGKCRRRGRRGWKDNIVIGSRFGTWLISEQIYHRISTGYWSVSPMRRKMSSHFTSNETQNANRQNAVYSTWTIRKCFAAILFLSKNYFGIFAFVVVVGCGVLSFVSFRLFIDTSIKESPISSVSCSSQFTTMYFRAFFPPFGGRSSHSWCSAYEWACAQYTCSFPKINYAIYSYLLIPLSLSTFSFATPFPLLCARPLCAHGDKYHIPIYEIRVFFCRFSFFSLLLLCFRLFL